MERNRPVETSQPVKEGNIFKQTVFSGTFPNGSTKSVCFIYFLSGITGIFVPMVDYPCLHFFLSAINEMRHIGLEQKCNHSANEQSECQPALLAAQIPCHRRLERAKMPFKIHHFVSTKFLVTFPYQTFLL